MSEMETVNITSPPSSPPEDFTVNLSDPWTISALILLCLLVLVASVRISRAVCYKKESQRVKTQPMKDVEALKHSNEDQKPFQFKSKKDMRNNNNS
tara:strand:+ start:1046 stop:1333 length:288 start_codon:yes stop_codon:yes gene_type:complete